MNLYFLPILAQTEGIPLSEEWMIILIILLSLIILGALIILTATILLSYLIIKLVRANREIRSGRIALRRLRESKEEFALRIEEYKELLEEKQADIRRAERLISLLRKENTDVQKGIPHEN